MLIINLKDQLGNQMFAYSSIKSIALKRGFEFGFYRTALDVKYVNDTDKKYGNEIHTIFEGLNSEMLSELPSDYNDYIELEHLKESNNNVEYLPSVEMVNDNTIMVGHFMSTYYFKENLENVRSWFRFPKDIKQKTKEQITKIKMKKNNRPIVSVHFRVGNDYLTRGFKLDDKYWFEAAEYIRKEMDDPVFVVFYDKLTSGVKKFIKKYSAINCRGTLVEDMCFIHMCDANIICNSSFSIMSAVLNQNAKIVVRPSKYPVSGGYSPDDLFMSEWVIVGKGNRSHISNVFNVLWKIKHYFMNDL